jgi:hypothetical protein
LADAVLGDGTRQALSAVLFMQAGMSVFDTYSTLNSSPWTAENVGASPEKRASLREYVCHAALYSSGYCLVSALIAGNPWPIYGALVNNAYLVWIYNRAVTRGMAAESAGEGWFDTWGGSSA